MNNDRIEQADTRAAEIAKKNQTDTASENTVCFSSQKTITVSKPVLTEENGMVILSAKVSGAVSGTCYYSTELENRDFVDDISSNCFMIGLLYTAMYAGCDLIIEGAVSERLLFHVKQKLIPILVDFFEGQVHPVKIHADQLLSHGYPEANGVGTGFSGGIDSFHTIRDYFVEYDGPTSEKINTLLFFNVGSHGMGSSKDRLNWIENKFNKRKKALSDYPKQLGLPFVSVNSNVFSFIQTGHLQTSSLASCSAALFLGRKMRLYYYGSIGFRYHEKIYPGSSVERDYDIAKIDDFVLPQICTESFTALSEGSRCSRAQKTMEICSDPLVRKYLNVCNGHETIAKNCSMCYKCQRTMLALDILGVLDKFSDVFDLDKFSSRQRSRYIAVVLNNRKLDPFLQDVYDLAKSRNYDLKSRTSLGTRLYMHFTETKLYAFLRILLRRDRNRNAKT